MVSGVCLAAIGVCACPRRMPVLHVSQWAHSHVWPGVGDQPVLITPLHVPTCSLPSPCGSIIHVPYFMASAASFSLDLYECVCGAYLTQAMVVTELCSGGDLARAMRRARPTNAFGWSMRGAKIALDVACGLAYLHKKGVSLPLRLKHKYPVLQPVEN
jgi:hypothetical protein